MMKLPLILTLSLITILAHAGEREDFVKALNHFRSSSRQCGSRVMPPADEVTLNATLNSVAQLHTNEIAAAGEARHQGNDGSRVKDRIRRSGYVASDQPILMAREDIAVIDKNQSLAEAVEAFAEDPAHCASIMSSDVTEVGIGYAIGKYDALKNLDTGEITKADARYITVVLAKPGKPGTLRQ